MVGGRGRSRGSCLLPGSENSSLDYTKRYMVFCSNRPTGPTNILKLYNDRTQLRAQFMASGTRRIAVNIDNNRGQSE